MANVEGKYSGTNSLQVAQKATTKMKVHIALYMPPSVQVSYGAMYNEQKIGVGAESIDAGIRAFMDTGSIAEGLGTAAGGMAVGAVNYAKNKLLTAVPGMEGADAVFAINRGSVITPRMELMFEGLKRRDFSFSFTFCLLYTSDAADE